MSVMGTSRIGVPDTVRPVPAPRARRGTAVPGARATELPAGPETTGAPGATGSGPVASVWLPSASCSPEACVAATEPTAAVPHAVLRLTAVLILVVTGTVLLPVVRLFPAAPRERTIRAWCRAVVRAVGVKVRITGAAPRHGGLLMVANHISWLDIPLLAAVRPGRMLAKTEIRQWPVAGALTARSGALFIDRDRLRALPATVARIADGLRAGSAVVVFPEGSTWCGRAQGYFRRAAFQAALDADVPVQPVRLHYRYDGGPASTAPAFVGSDSLLTSLWRVASARRLVAEVRVTPVLTGETGTDRRALALAAQQALDLPHDPHPDHPAHP